MSDAPTMMAVLLIAGFGIFANQNEGFDKEARRQENAKMLYESLAAKTEEWEQWHACQDHYSGAFSSGLRKVMCGEQQPPRPKFGSGMTDEEKVLVEQMIYSEQDQNRRKALLDIVRWTDYPPGNLELGDIVKGEWTFPEPTDQQRQCARRSSCRDQFGINGNRPKPIGVRKTN